MVPFHCGALLPTEQRNTSPQFLRYRRFRRRWLNVYEGAELIAFVNLVGVSAAGHIFGWHECPIMFKTYKAIERHAPMAELAQRMIQANAAATDEETGEAVLWAMKAGGFKRGRPPAVVANTLATYRRRGASVRELAEHFGFTVSQISTWLSPVPQRSVSLPQARVHLMVG